MSSEDPGLLGNLPRSRPGTRSDKRAAAAEQVREPAAKKPVPKARAKATAPKSAKRKVAAKPVAPKVAPPKVASPKGEMPRERVAAAEHEPGEPAGALRSAARVAGTGLRVAEGMTREVLRRLPRP